ncbi:MAG: efflux RND transporter periplasmic adaptor subunit [Synergistaceae bacterium]|jgi:HlyD family secretion protein|nr:efflux RND transporter periplasmic adaptor subunit [Synergistaceae bacterium]
MKKLLKLALVLIALGAAGYWGYSKTRPRVPNYVYRTQQVTKGTITSAISATGTVNAVETVAVGTQVSGNIKEIHADFNSVVKKGQLLAVLDPDVLASRMEESKASLTLAEAGVASAGAELDMAARAHERCRELWNRKLIARSELESAETSLALAKASLVVANARVTQANELLRQAATNLGYTKIVSPIDGVVISRAVDVGQTVTAVLQAPTLFLIARDLTRMRVEANIDEADIGRISEGQKATCKFDSWPGETFDATVTQKRLSPQMVSNVVTYVVILDIENREKKLMPGMTANISVITEQRDGVLRIPAAALRFTPPADAMPAAKRQDGEDAAGGGGLLMMPRRRPGAANDGKSASRAVWPVDGGELKGSVEIDETGVSDRTWVEARGAALKQLREGQELAVAFSTGAAAPEAGQ